MLNKGKKFMPINFIVFSPHPNTGIRDICLKGSVSKVLSHFLYRLSPNLVPSNYHLFFHFKRTSFSSIFYAAKLMGQMISSKAKRIFLYGLKKLEYQSQKRIEQREGYVE